MRRWGDDFELRDLLDQQPGGLDLATGDSALLTITTRDRPPKHKFDAAEVADSIRRAGIGDQVRFDPREPATDSARSLDFDRVGVTGALISPADVQVEVSYRESVVDPPLTAAIGAPYCEPFSIDAMQPHEIVAEKLRTLAQRSRATDLADIGGARTRRRERRRCRARSRPEVRARRVGSRESDRPHRAKTSWDSARNTIGSCPACLLTLQAMRRRWRSSGRGSSR